MSGKLFECGYGAILNEDVAVLEKCLAAILEAGTPALRICEIGMHDGNTARGLEAYCKAHGRELMYWGIDPDPGLTRPRYIPKDAAVIIGDSAEVFNQVPFGLDLVWVDGCHCSNHVMIETVRYGARVRPGGFMCYHDTNPACQGWGHQYHGPEILEFAVDVNRALEAIHFPWEPWKPFAEGCPDPTENIDCGTRAFRRTS
jgi:hypothetical protein